MAVPHPERRHRRPANPPPGTSSLPDPGAPLQPQDGKDLSQLDPPFHPFSQAPPSRTDGGRRDRKVSYLAGGGKEGERFHPEPGTERHPVPLPGGFEPANPLGGKPGASQGAAPPSCGPVTSGSTGIDPGVGGDPSNHGNTDVRFRPPSFGMLSASGQGCGFRPEPDLDPGRKGGSGPDHPSAGGGPSPLDPAPGNRPLSTPAGYPSRSRVGRASRGIGAEIP